ncbi:MAG: DUF5671 domain-containing protein [Candidatus Falkowbacteria bacterium]
MEPLKTQGSHTAKFAFYYLLSLVTLLFTALSVGMVWFAVIDLKVADTLAMGTDSGSLRFALSALLIAAPIYFWMARSIAVSLRKGELDHNAPIRRWLTYLILFIASVVVIGWLIGVFNTYFNGELTKRFSLKTLTALLISGVVFSYYFFDIQELWRAKEKIVRNGYLYGSVAVVILSLVFGFMFMESPRLARERRQDEQLLAQFDQIDGAINSYFAENQKLPASLKLLVDEKRIIDTKILTNPNKADEQLGYKPGKDKIYELCATFVAKSPDNTSYTYYLSQRWPHEAGYQCVSQRLTAIIAPDTKPIIAPVVK